MMLCNPSTFGPNLLGHIAGNNYDIFGVSETHLLPSRLGEATKQMHELGYSSGFTAAGPYKDIVAAGGTSLHIRSRLVPTFLLDTTRALPCGETPWDWTACAVPFEGFEVVFISIYLHSSIGFTGPNVQKLAQLRAWLKLLSKPWVVMGDWNMPPQQLANTMIFDDLACQLVAPVDATITCSRGQGALLDYAIAHQSLAWLLSEATTVGDAPWTTHLPVQFWVNRDTKGADPRAQSA